MSFLKRIFDLFSGGKQGNRDRLSVYVLSHRCKEPLAAEIDLRNSLSLTDDKGATFFTRKVIQGTGANRCFASVEVGLWFDGNRTLLRHEVSGGRWLDQEEYEEELARFLAPPEDDEVKDGEAEDGEAEDGNGESAAQQSDDGQTAGPVDDASSGRGGFG